MFTVRASFTSCRGSTHAVHVFLHEMLLWCKDPRESFIGISICCTCTKRASDYTVKVDVQEVQKVREPRFSYYICRCDKIKAYKARWLLGRCPWSWRASSTGCRKELPFPQKSFRSKRGLVIRTPDLIRSDQISVPLPCFQLAGHVVTKCGRKAASKIVGLASRPKV